MILSYSLVHENEQKNNNSKNGVKKPRKMTISKQVEDELEIKRYKINYLKHVCKLYLNQSIQVAELPPGAGFGELALMNNKTRAASIIALSQPTELATISKDSYINILDKQFQILMRRKIN